MPRKRAHESMTHSRLQNITNISSTTVESVFLFHVAIEITAQISVTHVTSESGVLLHSARWGVSPNYLCGARVCGEGECMVEGEDEGSHDGQHNGIT
jgi:hypothetical protein